MSGRDMKATERISGQRGPGHGPFGGGMIVIRVCHIQQAIFRDEQNVVQVRLHGDRAAHQPLADFGIDLAVFLSDAFPEFFQTAAG